MRGVAEILAMAVEEAVAKSAAEAAGREPSPADLEGEYSTFFVRKVPLPLQP